MKIEQAIADTLREANVRSVIAGISGGADSVAMLLGLNRVDVEITAVHCNFHLRGEESERDSRFVAGLCERIGIRLITIDFNVGEYMRKHKVSTEMACRELRYDEFRRIRSELNADRIAVAHNADDNAETLLLNLMRGTGVSGLRGMLPDTGEIIRPLLGVSRKEILEYLNLRQESYVTDSSNLSSDYRRNFLRNEVLPLLETRWPEARKSLSKTASIMLQEEKMLSWAERQILGNDSRVLPYSVLSACPDKLWAIHRFITKFGGSATQAEEMARSLESDDFQSGKFWVIRSGRIVMERDRFEFIADNAGIDNEFTATQAVSHKRYNADVVLINKIRSAGSDELWTTLSPERIVFRRHKTGDRIKPLGMTGSMPVSKIMKDSKLSTAQKEACLVAEDRETGEIIWVAGLKRSRLHLISEDSSECYHYRISHNCTQAEEQEADGQGVEDR